MSETKLGMVLFCQNYVSMEVETNSKRRRVLVAEAVGKKKKKKQGTASEITAWCRSSHGMVRMTALKVVKAKWTRRKRYHPPNQKRK